MSRQNRVLILTTAAGYTPDKTFAFRRSLEKTGFDGQIVMLMDRSAQKSHASVLGQNIEILPYTAPGHTFKKLSLTKTQRKIKSALYKLLKPVFLLASAVSMPLAYRLSTYFNFIMLNRNIFYYDYLLKNKDNYDWIVIADVRDIIFQDNPSHVFSNYADNDQSVFICGLENRTIGLNPGNARWIKRAYGPETLERHKDNPVSCAGAIMGSTDCVLSYLKHMCDECTRATYRLGGDHSGYDQGLHNIIVHEKRIPHIQLVKNFEGPLANLFGEDEIHVMHFVENRMLRRKDNRQPITLVHHYDLFPSLSSVMLSHLEETTLS